VLTKALSPAFFAREDTATPLKASLIGLVVAIIAAFLFDHAFGTSGIAAAIALGAWAGAIALTRSAASSFGFALLPATPGRLARIAASALAMAGLLWLAAQLPALNADAHRLSQAVSLALLIAGGLGLYLLLLALFGVASWRQAASAIRSGKPRDLRD
jgi:putative peptidoglycan lipid II flippase